jgi:hypothetical protein
MAKRDEDGASDMTSLGQIIGQAVAQGIAQIAPRKEMREGDPEYVAHLASSGWYDTFEHPVFQNGYEAEARGLSAEVRHRASHLEAGTYIKGRVRVEVVQDRVFLNYPTKGDAMLINRDYWRDFPDLINQIWAEMQAKVAA